MRKTSNLHTERSSRTHIHMAVMLHIGSYSEFDQKHLSNKLLFPMLQKHLRCLQVKRFICISFFHYICILKFWGQCLILGMHSIPLTPDRRTKREIKVKWTHLSLSAGVWDLPKCTAEALTRQTAKKWGETRRINAVNRSDLVDQRVDACVSRRVS